MDEQLKSDLREFGLLPVSLDEKAQEHYKALGFDPSKVESHYSPGTPEDILQRQMAIDKNVSRLHELETQGRAGCDDYASIEKQIRDDLDYLRESRKTCLHIGHKKAVGGIALTGTDGVYRDIFVASPDSPDFGKMEPLKIAKSNSGANAGHRIADK